MQEKQVQFELTWRGEFGLLVVRKTSEIFLLAHLLRKDLVGVRTVSTESLFYSSAL